MRERLRELLICLSLIGVILVVPINVGAHVSTGDVVGLKFPVVVFGSATIGACGGFAVIFYHSYVNRIKTHVAGSVGILLIGISLLVLLPMMTSQPILSGLSVVVGGSIAMLLPVHDDTHVTPTEATSTAVALTLHQLMEGVVLAAAYVAGGVVGLIAALFLTAHTVVETAAVGTAYVVAGQYKRGGIAVVFMQTVYVIAAVIAFRSALAVPPAAEHITTAIVGSVLLIVGIHSCRCVIDDSISYS